MRRVAYAATATRLAHSASAPSPTFAAATATPPPSPLPPSVTPVFFPTSSDLHILPTPLPSVTLPPGAPPRATPHPRQFEYDLLNFLILGSDRNGGTGAYRTDAIVVVSVNRTTQTVNLLSIPRDLYVYIPGWGMDRINTAEVHQMQIQSTSHRLGLLAETIEYNLGITIHHLARVDFEGFRSLIDQLGGLDIPVDCAVSGYRLRSPELNPDEAANWDPFTLETGVHRLDGSLALWYVRQRMDSSDFERNRRQQIVLRALWHKIRENDLAQSLPLVWEQLNRMVETDLTLDEALGLLPLLLTLDESRVEGHFLGLDEVNLWQAPGGANVLVIDPIPFQATMQHFLTPPTQNRLAQERARVAVLNASSIGDADQLAAARLQWLGLVAVPQGMAGAGGAGYFARTTIYDHTGRVKGSSLAAIQGALGVADSDVVSLPDPGRAVDFTVVVGQNYIPCVTSPWRPFPQPE
ncbi:MAG: LCP family protein [Anaerolineae bacterium]